MSPEEKRILAIGIVPVALLVFAIVQAPLQYASAVQTTNSNSNNGSNNSSGDSVATNNTTATASTVKDKHALSFTTAANYEKRFDAMAWHYDKTKSANKNLKSFEEWWCVTSAQGVTWPGKSDGKFDGSDKRVEFCSQMQQQNLKSLRSLMSFYEENREAILWGVAWRHASSNTNFHSAVDMDRIQGWFYSAYENSIGNPAYPYTDLPWQW